MTHNMDPRTNTTRLAETTGNLEESTIRRLILSMARLLLAQNKPVRARLSHNGNIRVTKGEVMGKVEAGLLHSDMGVESSTHLTPKVVKDTPTDEERPVYA